MDCTVALGPTAHPQGRGQGSRSAGKPGPHRPRALHRSATLTGLWARRVVPERLGLLCERHPGCGASGVLACCPAAAPRRQGVTARTDRRYSSAQNVCSCARTPGGPLGCTLQRPQPCSVTPKGLVCAQAKGRCSTPHAVHALLTASGGPAPAASGRMHPAGQRLRGGGGEGGGRRTGSWLRWLIARTPPRQD